MSKDFTLTENERPPLDVVVETIDGGGCVRDLVRKDKGKGNLYFFPDGDYVYFVPKMWRHIPYVPRT